MKSFDNLEGIFHLIQVMGSFDNLDLIQASNSLDDLLRLKKHDWNTRLRPLLAN